MHLSDVTESLRWVLAAVLIAATILKADDRVAFRRTLADLGLPARLVVPAGWAILGVETAVAATMLGGPRMVAGWAATVLFVVFGIVLVRLRSAAASCGCLGRLQLASHHLGRRLTLRAAGAGSGVLIALTPSPVAVPTPAQAGLAIALLAGLSVPFGPALWRAAKQMSASRPATAGATSDGLSRRAFLHRAATATLGAVAVLMLLPGRLLAATVNCDAKERACNSCCEQCFTRCMEDLGDPTQCLQRLTICHNACSDCRTYCGMGQPDCTLTGCWNDPDMCN